MGLFKKSNRVRGTAQVVGCSAYSGEGTWQNCRMSLVVQADGVAPTAVEIHTIVRSKKWPHPGQVLPVDIDPANPTDVDIQWGEVASGRDQSRQNAEAIAAAMRASGGAGDGLGALGGLGGAQIVNLSGRDLSQLTDEQRAKLRMLGIDPSRLAGGAPGAATSSPAAPWGAPTGSVPPGEPIDGRIELLERLGRLREQDILTDEEFTNQKRQILEA